jgi:hypothetical protein
MVKWFINYLNFIFQFKKNLAKLCFKSVILKWGGGVNLNYTYGKIY